MVAAGAVEEARAAWARPLSDTARKVLGLEAFATLPLDEAVEAVVVATRQLARYQRKWLRRLPVAATLAADRPPKELADEIVALAGAGKRLPRRR
jgi:tRNA A37 N6-isopentenylltransferase MiaA